MRLRYALTAIMLTAGLTAGIATAAPALAGTGDQYAVETVPFAYANAWNGGPWIEVYTSQTVNNDFSANNAGGHYVALEDTGTHNSWYGMCMGDAYNAETDYQVSLDSCPSSSGSGGGWGTKFTPGICTLPGGLAGIDFKDLHTGYYLEPEGSSNGDKFDLVGSLTCYNIYPPA